MGCYPETKRLSRICLVSKDRQRKAAVCAEWVGIADRNWFARSENEGVLCVEPVLFSVAKVPEKR